MNDSAGPAIPAVRQKALQEELKELTDVVGAGPLVDLLLERAFELNATDIHFDPQSDGLRVRVRLDGLMHDVAHIPSSKSSQMLSRVKVMSGMDIAEKRLPQDGHISDIVMGQQRDVRVACGPTCHGERLVLRLMPGTHSALNLDHIGLEDGQLEILKSYLRIPYGMILSVGPVGSGKSTTLYGCLESLNDPTQSIVTIEDPIERRIFGINQTQVHLHIDFTFVRALRMLLRQDPDVMMIGEIRDPETAQIGARAGLAGTLVLSTLHANDTAAAFDVFRGYGVPSMIIADSVYCVVSQRLIRKVCHECQESYRPDEATCAQLGIPSHEADGTELFRAPGCDGCFGTGYLGRTGVFEIMGVDGEIRTGVLHEMPRTELIDLARSKGMVTLERAATNKVRAGITSCEEMNRVLAAFPAG